MPAAAESSVPRTGSKTACDSYDLHALRAITMQRNAYDDADEFGASVLECNDDKAAAEIAAIAQELNLQTRTYHVTRQLKKNDRDAKQFIQNGIALKTKPKVFIKTFSIDEKTLDLLDRIAQ